MSYQLPPLSDEYEFERLIRDILRRVYKDASIETFGRKGQSQFGIDGYSPTNPKITFQCKLKDVRFKDDSQLRNVLLSEMEEELNNTKGLAIQPERFIFASTFKNDRQLQEKAGSLSTDSLTVEYWGWDTISEKVWKYKEFLIPVYYPQIPIRQVSGFRPITPELIAESKTIKTEDLNKLAIDYYRINDRGDVVLRVVCNNIDVRNDKVMNYTLKRLKSMPPSGTLWILGNGGSGKTTILHRLAVELAELNKNVYMLDLENHLSKDDLETILLWLKYGSTSEQTVLCIDNPAADDETLEMLLRRIPDYCTEIHILLAERDHRYKTLKKTGSLIYLHGEEEYIPVHVHNPSDQRQKVYQKLFDLLGISDIDRTPLLNIALNERIVYVNATYSILLELKRQGKIGLDFAFDWDDYRKLTEDLPAFREGYKYIALFYLFGVKTPFTVLSKIFAADITQQKLFRDKFRGLVNEPIVLDERRDAFFREIIYVRTKHEIVSEIFFQVHPQLNKDALLMEWCENTNFGSALEAQALINVFGAKKNYSNENSYINFPELIDFFLKGQLHKKVALSPKLNETLHLAKFWLLLLQDKPDDAVNLLESFLKNEPERLHARTELARIYQRQGKLDEAETLLLKILDIKANDLNSRTELAKIYQRQGKLDEAEAVLMELLKIDTNNLQARTELARIYQRQGKLDEAETLLLKILDIKANDLNSRTELAKIYQRQNKFDKAEALLTQAMNIKANDLNSHTEMAKTYVKQGKLIEAETILIKLLKIDKYNIRAYTELAKIYQRQYKLNKAEIALLKVLNIKPEDINSRTELARIYQRQGKLDEAETLLLKILDIKANDLQARVQLSKVYQRQGKLNDAITRAEEVLVLDPLNDYAISELLEIWKQQGKKEKCSQRFLEFITQPNYRFDRSSYTPIFKFFRLCKEFNMKEFAEQVFERFKSELDERNFNYYMTNFK